MNFFNTQIDLLNRQLFPNTDVVDRIIKSKRYLDQNYDQEITIEDCCLVACMSKYHFIRKFRAVYGYTPIQYLQQKRMAAARQILRDGHPVSSACYTVGYQSLGTFSNTFKKYAGMSPSDFQKSNYE